MQDAAHNDYMKSVVQKNLQVTESQVAAKMAEIAEITLESPGEYCTQGILYSTMSHTESFSKAPQLMNLKETMKNCCISQNFGDFLDCVQTTVQ